MLYRSTAYKNAIKGTVRKFNAHIRFNGTATEVRANTGGIVSIKHYSSVADADRPMFGCAVSSYIEATWLNSAVSGVSLANSYIDVWIGPVYMSGGFNTYDPKYLGRFWIADISRGDTTTTVTAYDELSKLSKEYVPTVTPTGGVYNISDIVDDIVSQCGLGYADSTLTGTVDTLYSGTCREVLGWVCNVTSDSTFNGCNIKPHRIANSTTPQNLALNTASLYTAWQTKDDYVIDENTIYLGGLDDAEDFEVQSVVSGTTDAPVSAGSGTGLVGPNPYMTNTIATDIYNNVNGITFTPMTIEFRGDPAIEIGDVVKVTKGGVSKYCYIQRFVTHFDGGLKQDLYCYGDSEYYYDMSTSPTTAKINTVSTMLQEIAQSIETANGGVITKILDTDGTWKELVIANSVDLDTATSVWRFNINGLAHSDRYQGGTYTLAMDTQGRIVANVIQTGTLQDAAGKNSWDLDTGAFTITDGSINITTSSATFDTITLGYQQYTIKMSPMELSVANTNLNKKIAIQASMIYGYSPIGTQMLSIDANGTIYTHSSITTLSNLYVGADVTVGTSSLTGNYIIKDTSNYQRMILAYDGLTFKNTSGDKTAFYPNQTQEVTNFGTLYMTGCRFYHESTATDAPSSATGRDIFLSNLSGNVRYWLSFQNSSSTSYSDTVFPYIKRYNNTTGWTNWKKFMTYEDDTVSTSGTDKTYNLDVGMYLVATARLNNSSKTQDGLWLVSAHTTGHISAILAPSGGTTATISGRTLTVHTGSANVAISVIKISS